MQEIAIDNKNKHLVVNETSYSQCHHSFGIQECDILINYHYVLELFLKYFLEHYTMMT